MVQIAANTKLETHVNDASEEQDEAGHDVVERKDHGGQEEGVDEAVKVEHVAVVQTEPNVHVVTHGLVQVRVPTHPCEEGKEEELNNI